MTSRSASGWIRPTVIFTLLLVTTLALTWIYYWAFAEYPGNSDTAGGYLAAADMAAGNWRLKGWWWGSDTFWTSDLAFEAALIALFGNHPIIMMLSSAFDWAGVVVLAAVATGAGVSRFRFALLPVAAIVALPILRNNPPMNLIVLSPIHIGTIIYILAMFLLVPIASTVGRKSKIATIALGLTTFLAVAGDPLALVIGVGAISLVMAIGALKRRNGGKAVVLATVVAAALLAKYFVAWNQAHGGIRVASTPLTFVSVEDLPRNLYLTFNSFLVLTGTNFFGRGLSGAILFLVRLPLILAMIWVLWTAFRRIVRYVRGADEAPEPTLIDQLLLAGAVIDIVSATFSSLLVNVDTARYFIPAIIFLAILMGRTLPPVRSVVAYGCLTVGATIALLGYGYAVARPAPTLLYPRQQALADLLIRQHLTDGYASYWSASIITVGTRGAARVRTVAACTDPVGCGKSVGKIVPVFLIGNENWYSGFGRRDRPFFVVVDKFPVAQALLVAPVTATFGAPTHRFELPSYVVEIFDPVAR
ncbi:hypothetical protein [Gluconacetobacter tumulicola]|uniref:Glycosyltransferase RgtA/B/C/D-like domain-containing protein n=1 Tax=Gluconacetobacter tumulicola TaxID=1017177 RepID=A0A7W4JD87_9PROT|nr:hypothetical protein [Gluconacetobacter tumulicola]MBB2178939.1 hypothetical protein [Gluconacetobacter tumulicola]